MTALDEDATLTDPRRHGPPSEDDVRRLVSNIVDGVLGEGAHAASDTASRQASPDSAARADAAGIAIGADHGGYPLKERLVFKLKEAGWDVIDCGTDSHDSVDYPDYAFAVAEKVSSGACRWGVIVDGAGIGSAMVANKVPGVRAALCYDVSSARNSREHNHANVLTLGAGSIGEGLAWQIVEEWLRVDWGGGRHARRVAKIDEIEKRYVGPK